MPLLLLGATEPEREAEDDEGADAAPDFALPEVEDEREALPDLVLLPVRVAPELLLLELEALERVAAELLMVPPFARVELWELWFTADERVALELPLLLEALELLRWADELLRCAELELRLALLLLRLAELVLALLRLAELLVLRDALELRLAEDEELEDERVEDDLDEELLLREAPPLRVCASAVPSANAATIAAAKTVLSTCFITLIVLV